MYVSNAPHGQLTTRVKEALSLMGIQYASRGRNRLYVLTKDQIEKQKMSSVFGSIDKMTMGFDYARYTNKPSDTSAVVIAQKISIRGKSPHYIIVDDITYDDLYRDPSDKI